MSEKGTIRVLIVDDIAETRENVRRSLQFDTSIEVVGTARNGKEAIQLAEELKPDVAIMDINMPDMDGIQATEALRKKVPYAQVIILSVQSDPNYMRQAMLVGARDFLAKPPSIDELLAAIQRAGKVAEEERIRLSKQQTPTPVQGFTSSLQPQKAGKIITIYSPKGGNGCTTIAINLAFSLINSTTNILVVDANMQFGDVAIFLNQQVKNSVLDLTPRVDELDAEIIDSVLIKHTGSDLHLLAAPTRPENAANVDAEQFGKLLGYLRNLYSFIIIDTTSYLTECVQMALELSDLIVLITTQDIPSIKNASLFLSLADQTGISREAILLIMNKYDKRIAITPEQIAKNLRQEVVVTFPLEEKMISFINRGVPFYPDNKTHPLAKCFQSLASLICEKTSSKEEKG